MLRLGLVDFDSSHSVEFTRRLNQVGVSRDQFVSGAKVVLGSPGVSRMSPERIAPHAKSLSECGVEFVDSPEQMLGRVDGILVLSVCGQEHLKGARPFLEAGVPAFVDKPFACSQADAREMAELAKQTGSLLWSSSALRFAEEVQSLTAEDSQFGAVRGAMTFGPAQRAEENPGLLHYGIHAAEVLFALMGADCEQVSCLHRPNVDLVSATFSENRLASLRGLRSGSRAYGFTAFCENGILHQLVSTRYAYRNLCRAIVDSFQTGQAPVPMETTLTLIRFLLAARESEQAGGRFVSLNS